MDNFDAQLDSLLDDDDEFATPTTKTQVNPYHPKRTPEEQAEVDARKERGEVPTGRKTSVANITQRDADLLLIPLGVLGPMTCAQLSILGVKGTDPRGKTDNTLRDPRTVSNRLSVLRKIGVVEYAPVPGGTPIWGLTNKGVGAALRFTDTSEEGQITRKSVSGIKYDDLPHKEAVNWVAAQLLSPAAYWKRAFKMPPRVTVDMMKTEHSLTSEWTNVNKQLAEVRKGGDGYMVKFRDWRSDRIRQGRDDATNGRIKWSHLTGWYPGLWVPAHPIPAGGSAMNEHHIPDLVVNLEQFRKGDKRVSIAIEVELTAKTITSYRRQFELWRRELENVDHAAEATVYARLIYFTNHPLVKERIEEVAADLVERGLVTVLPLTGRDGQTPLKLSNKTQAKGERE